jgi:hypothetical protein
VLDGIEHDLAIALVGKDNDGRMGRYLADFIYDLQTAESAGALSAARPQIEQHNIAPFAEIR